jgi:hypothetical protein
MAKHFAIIKSDNGQAEQFPLKGYVRQNRNLFPNIDPDTKTTGHIRRNLINQGWVKQTIDDEVFLIRPDELNDIEYATSLIEIINEEIENSEDLVDELTEISFGLEKDLQTALRKNIISLGADLKIIDGGNERTTEAGRIDITAKDKNDTTVVIELKAGMAKPEVIAQTLSYMTALKREGHASIRGIIIANSFQDRVKLAAEAIDNLELVEYAFQFSFKTIK